MKRPTVIAPPKGKLGVLLPGMGAVATTFIAGTELVRRGMAQPVGSLTQLGTIRLGKRTEGRSPAIKQFVPLEKLENLVFGGWDIFPDDAYETATKAGVEGRQQLRIHTPLIHLSKAGIIRLGLELGVDYSLTHSCYDPSPQGLACGRCDSCQLRKRGFAEAGVSDPTRYG